MTTFCYIALALLVPWVLIGITIAALDARIRRTHQLHLDTRAWTEKVDAMRRMHDQEGEA
jgi:hypothetical protein